MNESEIALLKKLSAEEETKKKILTKYRKLLNSYARFIGAHKGSECMHNVETSLVRIVLGDVAKDYPEDIKIALAGVYGQSISFTQVNIGYLMRIPFGYGSRMEFDEELLRIKKQAIQKSVEWIVKRRSGVLFILFGKEQVVSEKELIKTITALV